MATIWERKTAVENFVRDKIVNLQRMYCTEGENSTSSRATLAILRRGKFLSPWQGVGDSFLESIFDDWDEELLGKIRMDSKEMESIRAALQLYALHQQSLSVGVYSAKNGSSFGEVCFKAAPDDLEKQKAIRRRMAFTDSARSISVSISGIRAIISLIKGTGSPVRLNYSALAGDIYLLQFPSMKKGVSQRWAESYSRAKYGYSKNNKRK